MKTQITEAEVKQYFSGVMTFEEKLSRDDIMKCIKNKKWQAFRKTLKGQSTTTKLQRLRQYKASNPGHCSTVVVRNYINALKRGGQIK
jgi:Ni,Fe-hydrogenase III component G